MRELVYLNGWIGTFEEAFVSVNDRGYIFGDGIYEVIKAYNGKMFTLEEHLQRLEASLAAVEITSPYSKEEIAKISTDLLEKSGIKEALIYIQISRGIAPRNHIYEPDLKPSLLITIRHIPTKVTKLYEEGAFIVSKAEFRWQLCNIKSISLQASVLAKNAAHKVGAQEVVFFLPNKTVTECGASNIFMIKNNSIYTHPANNRILAGITRQQVLEIAKKINLNIRIEPFSLDELYSADEVFITGTGCEILPIIKVDNNFIGNKKPGEITKQLIAQFNALTHNL